jgi:hypothetical protein
MARLTADQLEKMAAFCSRDIDRLFRPFFEALCTTVKDPDKLKAPFTCFWSHAHTMVVTKRSAVEFNHSLWASLQLSISLEALPTILETLPDDLSEADLKSIASTVRDLWLLGRLIPNFEETKQRLKTILQNSPKLAPFVT